MQTTTIFKTLLLTAALSFSNSGLAWHTYYHGGYYHGWGGGGYYRGGGYYHGWGYGGPRVIVAPAPGNYYYPGYRYRCSYVQQCYPNGQCVQRQVCR